MRSRLLKGSLDFTYPFRVSSYNFRFRRDHPDFFDPYGLLVFSGPQGSGKTLSAVQYCKKVLAKYPKCLFVTNVDIKDLPIPSEQVIEYNGLQCLFEVSNGYNGVLYLIDEIHLEFNSLESKSISIEEMTEFAQQRKQRKHIVGTSQVFMRLAKPLREQVRRVVVCKNYFHCLQVNTEVDGTTAYEEGGHLVARSRGKYFWFHTPELYQSYDTFAKMRRYKDEWQGRKLPPQPLPYSDSKPMLATSKRKGSGRNGKQFHVRY